MQSSEYPQTWYVYVLAYPSNTVFYVGKGTGNRIVRHEAEAKSNCRCRKCDVIRSVWRTGKAVKARIVFETLNEEEALVYESALIRQYAETLINIMGMPEQLEANNNFNRVIRSHPKQNKAKPVGRSLLGKVDAAKISGWKPEVTNDNLDDVWVYWRDHSPQIDLDQPIETQVDRFLESIRHMPIKDDVNLELFKICAECFTGKQFPQ